MESQPNHPPSVIFLDAVGTLFGVRGSVGQVYSDLSRQFGVEVAPEVLDRAFYQSFKAAGSPAFAAIDAAELQAQEFAWWLAIASQTFREAGVLHQFQDFAEFFAELFAHFATADPWFMSTRMFCRPWSAGNSSRSNWASCLTLTRGSMPFWLP